MVPYLQVEGLTRLWGEVTLFKNISFTIAKDQKVALIARNGTGKTTLLNILMGLDESDAGTYEFTPGVSVGYLNQLPNLNENNTVLEEVYESSNEVIQAVEDYNKAINGELGADLTKAMERMDHLRAWDHEVRVKQILSQLKITNFHQKISELSGGQQKRVAMANVLINEPDFLLLDEPTNHLDLDMIEWLEEYLRKSKSTLFMVTHDRYFLDRVCDEILELDQHSIYRYKGNYSYFLEKQAERKEIMAAEVEKAKNLMRTELEWMRRMPKARGSKAKYRVDSFYDLKEKASKRLEEREVELNMISSRLGKKIIDIYNVSKAYEELVLIDDFSYKFARYEKVGIVGVNGTGKSTLLNIITGKIKHDKGKIDIGETVQFGYYHQDGIQFNTEDRVIDVVKEIAEVINLGNGQKMTATQMLSHFLFPHDVQYARVEKLSGGEKRRLYLCTILMQNPNFLILDEPTNDLDIMTLNILEDYLQYFGGCVLIVSHDRYFMDKIVDHIFVFEGKGKIKDFPGNYSIYRDWKDEKDLQNRESSKKTKEAPQEKSKNNYANKLTYNEKRELEQIEDKIPRLEEKKSKLEIEMNSGDLNHLEIEEKSKAYHQIKEELDELELRWLELSEKNG